MNSCCTRNMKKNVKNVNNYPKLTIFFRIPTHWKKKIITYEINSKQKKIVEIFHSNFKLRKFTSASSIKWTVGKTSDWTFWSNKGRIPINILSIFRIWGSFKVGKTFSICDRHTIKRLIREENFRWRIFLKSVTARFKAGKLWKFGILSV